MTQIATAPTDERGGGPHRILIVEDEIPFLRMLHANLQRRGYKLQAATSGKQALNFATQCASSW